MKKMRFMKNQERRKNDKRNEKNKRDHLKPPNKYTNQSKRKAEIKNSKRNQDNRIILFIKQEKNQVQKTIHTINHNSPHEERAPPGNAEGGTLLFFLTPGKHSAKNTDASTDKEEAHSQQKKRLGNDRFGNIADKIKALGSNKAERGKQRSHGRSFRCR